jgi:hypothetical protein
MVDFDDFDDMCGWSMQMLLVMGDWQLCVCHQKGKQTTVGSTSAVQS